MSATTAQYSCHFCQDYTTMNANDMIAHWNNRTPLACTSCPRRLPCHGMIRIHYEVAHGIHNPANTLRCQFCHSSFPTDIRLRFHLGNGRNVNTACRLCNFVGGCAATTSLHMADYHPQG